MTIPAKAGNDFSVFLIPENHDLLFRKHIPQYFAVLPLNFPKLTSTGITGIS